MKFIVYCSLFVFYMILSYIYINFAKKFNIIDRPNERSSHEKPVVRGGGVLFLCAIIIFFIQSGFEYTFFFLGVLIISVISFIDDIITLEASTRLPFQFIAIGLCIIEIGFSISSNPLIIISLLIAGVGFINVYNFMDGVNGMTGFYTIINLTLFYLINMQENIVNEKLILCVLISILAFGFFNFRKKAAMFSGDIGSMSLAVLLFFISLLFIKKMNSPVIILFSAVYGVDGIFTIIYRKSIGQSITQAHRLHIYQKMVHSLNYSHLKVSSIFFLLQLLINLIIYNTYKLKLLTQYLVILVVLILLGIGYFICFKIVEKKNE